MTMTRPCRRITLHLSQIFLTLGLTFTGLSFWSSSLVAVDDPAAGQVVGLSSTTTRSSGRIRM